MTPSATRHAPILATESQREKEALAIRLLGSAPVQEQLAVSMGLFAADPLGQTGDGAATVGCIANALAMSACLYAANEDADRPLCLWATCAHHEWMDLSVPASGYGLDNPDNVYRFALLVGDARYEIRGHFNGHPPAQQTMVMFTSIPGMTQTMNATGNMKETSGVRSDALVLESDGSFVVTIDSDPAGSRPNHMQTDPTARGLHLMVRDSLSDWSAEWPVELHIRRVDGVTPRPLGDESALPARAAEILRTITPYWRDWMKSHVHGRPVNEVVQPWARLSGWGFTQQGSFSFAPGEAWVVTLDPLGAGYFNLQTADPWGIAREYITQTSSLNGNQAEANSDGTVTFVICDQDPGVFNWLDTDGLRSGTFQARWQRLPPQLTSSDGSVRGAKVVPLADLREALPPSTRFVTPDERREQLRERTESYSVRLR